LIKGSGLTLICGSILSDLKDVGFSVINMSTIAIKEETKRELLKFVSELQIKLGRRVDFDEAI